MDGRKEERKKERKEGMTHQIADSCCDQTQGE